MAEEAAGQPEAVEEKKGGSLKTVLIIIIVILLLGAAGGIYTMMPEKVVEPRSLQWPPQEEQGLLVSASLHDQSGVLLTEVRFVTEPYDRDNAELEASIIEDFTQNMSVIANHLTEVAVDLDAESASDPTEFKRKVILRLNDELTHCEIERVLIKDWNVVSME